MASDDSSILSDCSSPLSSPAISPSPPPEFSMLSYPSPPASQESSDTGSPCPDGMDSTIVVSDKDGPPPAKRRRISDRKSRTTEYLDLRHSAIKEGEQPQLDRLMKVLNKRRKIVVVAGAGISVSAGIPDFRSSTGLFTSLRGEYNLKGSGKDLFDASVYRDDSSTSSFHDMVRSMSKLTKNAKPTTFHHMLATLAQDDRLLRLYTQNVDGIDTGMEPLATNVPLRKNEAGKWPKSVQLHGGLDKMVCSKCSQLSEFDADLFDGPLAPVCSACVELDRVRTEIGGKRSHGIGRLRPRMVLYNEHNPDEDAIGNVVADDLRKRPDAVIVVGTSLKIPGVKRIVREMCATVRDRRDGVAIWINNDPEPMGVEFKDCWDIVVRGTCDEVARRVGLRHWYAMEDKVELTPGEWDDVCKKENEVVINRTFKPVSTTEKFRRASSSPEFSPIASRTASVFDSESTDCDEIILGAPPTPSKSARNSPAKQTAFDALSQKKPPPSKRGVGRPRKDGTNPKPKATTVSKSKAKPTATANKAKPKTTIRINQAMTQTKSFTTAATGKGGKASAKPTAAAAGHKRGRSQDPVMRPVSPENVRVNSPSQVNTPSKLRYAIFPGLSPEKPVKRDARMSLDRLIS